MHNADLKFWNIFFPSSLAFEVILYHSCGPEDVSLPRRTSEISGRFESVKKHNNQKWFKPVTKSEKIAIRSEHTYLYIQIVGMSTYMYTFCSIPNACASTTENHLANLAEWCIYASVNYGLYGWWWLVRPSHYLNQSWLIVSCNIGNKF